MVNAAGILIIASNGKALFLKRGSASDRAGEWCLPGGTTEDGETAQQTAIREAEEETGYRADLAELRLWTRRIAVGDELNPSVDFTTFLCRIDGEFIPKADDEHVAYAWAPPSQPPEPLHPGCRIALDRLTMDELGVARAIAAGELTSPQQYENVTLFDLRITGTGASYRRALDEFVWRDPSLYLNDEFLARCNGLPVIWEHPKNTTLNSKEFSDRIIGTILLPHIKDEEVWGVAKVYDAAAAELLANEQLSTSPAVVLRDAESEKLKLEDGSILLIEGKPSLLDHLAICDLGVWDKGGPPTGVSSTGKVTDMAEEKAGEEHREDHGRADAAVHEKLDKIMGRLDSAHGRLDALEARRGDAETEEEKRAKERERDDAAKRSRRDSEDDEGKFADAVKRGDAKKKGPVEGFTEGGVFHPIRSSAGYSKRKAGDSEDEYRARHDAEEESERKDLEGCGMAGDRAADSAKRHRRDAEEEDEREDRSRRDAEEKDRQLRDAYRRRDASRKDQSFEEWAKEEEEEPEHREDAERHRRADAAAERENADLRQRLARLEGTLKDITRETPAEERDALAAAQARADSIAALFGERVPPPNVGETPLSYRRRMAQRMARHSPQFKDGNFASADSATLNLIENQVYADAQSAARNLAGNQAGILVPYVTVDAAGRQITRFHGDPMAWMQHFMTGASVGRINRNPKGA